MYYPQAKGGLTRKVKEYGEYIVFFEGTPQEIQIRVKGRNAFKEVSVNIQQIGAESKKIPIHHVTLRELKERKEKAAE